MVIAELPPIDVLTAIEPQTVNFDTVLEPGGESLVSVEWTSPAGVTLGSGQYASTISSDARKSTVWLVGPHAAGVGHYLLNAHYTTDSDPPRVDDVQVGVTLLDL